MCRFYGCLSEVPKINCSDSVEDLQHFFFLIPIIHATLGSLYMSHELVAGFFFVCLFWIIKVSRLVSSIGVLREIHSINNEQKTFACLICVMRAGRTGSQG